MKQLISLLLVLVMLSATAFAMTPANFENVPNVEVTYDAAAPEAFKVRAGFGGEGHLIARYSNASSKTFLPLMFIAFTTDEGSAESFAVRTDCRRYAVTRSNLAAAGLTVIDTEGTMLVSPACIDFFRDVATSEYARVTIDGQSRMVTDTERSWLSAFIADYDSDIAPLIESNETVAKVYTALAPTVTSADAEPITPRIEAIRSAEYTECHMDDRSETVAAVQQGLIDLGYLGGRADGIFGKKTAAAVIAFRSDNGMEATAVADAEMQIAPAIALLAD
ncbi:MAG: peptidoglycan-binding protein [Clostridia bacterium]|nr:peptidoglycan-binding protein [Clostridia bacterium]